MRVTARTSRDILANGRSTAGFTLLEVLIVLVIVSILLAFAVPAFFGDKAAAAILTAKGTAFSYQEGVEQFAADANGRYPAYPNANEWADDAGPIDRFGPRKNGQAAAYYMDGTPPEVASEKVLFGQPGDQNRGGVEYTQLGGGTGYRIDVSFDGEVKCTIGTEAGQTDPC